MSATGPEQLIRFAPRGPCNALKQVLYEIERQSLLSLKAGRDTVGCTRHFSIFSANDRRASKNSRFVVLLEFLEAWTTACGPGSPETVGRRRTSTTG